MASGKNNYLDNKILNYIFNAGTFAAPTSVYCALFTTAPTAAVGSGTEVTGGSYARVTVACTTSNFATTTTQTITNANPIIFPTATASWGTVVAAAFYDASTSGNMLYWGTLTSSVAVASGNTFEFLASGFSVSEA